MLEHRQGTVPHPPLHGGSTCDAQYQFRIYGGAPEYAHAVYQVADACAVSGVAAALATIDVDTAVGCVLRCGRDPRCRSWHWSRRSDQGGPCVLYGAADAPTFIYRSGPAVRLCGRREACEAGYVYRAGSLPGAGQVAGKGGGAAVSSCSQCAALCSSEAKCGAYECSASAWRCDLNYARDPTDAPARDSMFCAKGMARRGGAGTGRAHQRGGGACRSRPGARGSKGRDSSTFRNLGIPPPPSRAPNLRAPRPNPRRGVLEGDGG